MFKAGYIFITFASKRDGTHNFLSAPVDVTTY